MILHLDYFLHLPVLFFASVVWTRTVALGLDSTNSTSYFTVRVRVKESSRLSSTPNFSPNFPSKLD